MSQGFLSQGWGGSACHGGCGACRGLFCHKRFCHNGGSACPKVFSYGKKRMSPSPLACYRALLVSQGLLSQGG